MKYIEIDGQKVSVITSGCMRFVDFSEARMETHIKACLEMGINFFDHADIYGNGVCETIFGTYLKAHPEDREKMFIQSKCGIGKGCYDFSYEHIMESVEGSLKRLQTDHLDFLLLHRPDALMEAEEVNRAFNELYEQGKVLRFGVSNMNAHQIAFLQKYLDQKLLIDQLQMSLVHTPLIDSGLHVNMKGIDYTDEGTLEYLKEKQMTMQVWSPLQVDLFKGAFLNSTRFPMLNTALEEVAEEYGCTRATIAIAWLLRYPSAKQIIIGSTSVEHIQEAAAACDIELTRKQWYDLYLAAGHSLP